jgi:hypothetical protein
VSGCGRGVERGGGCGSSEEVGRWEEVLLKIR